MQFIYRKIFSFRLPGYSLSWEHFTHMNLLCSCFCPAYYIIKSPWFQEDFTFFSNFLRSNISPAFYGAATVPIPRPSILPSPKKVTNAVTIRQVTSKPILILEYGTFVISDTSRGNRSIGTIGSLQRFGWSVIRWWMVSIRSLDQLFCPLTQDLSSFIFGSVPFRIRYF